MADEKISALTEATSASDNNLLAMVRGGVTNKIKVTTLFSSGLTNIADSTIGSAKINFANKTVPGSAIKDGEISDTQLDNDCVTGPKLADNSTAVVVADVTSLPDGAYKGQLAYVVDTTLVYIWDNTQWQPIKAAGNISTVTTSNAGIFHLQINIDGATKAADIEAVVEESEAPNQFLAGPIGDTGPVSYRIIDPSDLPVATASDPGTVLISGEGLRMSSSDNKTLEIDNDVEGGASTQVKLVSYSDKGLIISGRDIESDDMPAATSSAKGAVQAGTGLEIGAEGVINHKNKDKSGEFVNVTVDDEGHVTSGSSTLTVDNLPNIPTDKLTGTLAKDQIGINTIEGSKLADNSTVQFGGAANSGKVVGFPKPEYKGQLFYDRTNKELYISVSNENTAYEAITQVSGNLVLAGTYDADESKMVSVTAEGQLRSFVVGQDLPTPTESNKNYYVVVSVAGTPAGTGGAPAVALAPPDLLLSLGTGVNFKVIKSSATLSSIAASSVSFDNASTGLDSQNVQGALAELDTEKAPKATPTFVGNVEIEAGDIVLTYTDAVDSKKATIKTTTTENNVSYTLPNVTTDVNIITSGDSDSITNTMIADGAIKDAQIFDSSTTTPSTGIDVKKLAPGTTGHILVSFTDDTDGNKVKVGFKDTITPANITASGTVLCTGSLNRFTNDVSLRSGLKFENTPSGDENAKFTRFALEGDPTDDNTITIPNKTSTLALLGVSQTYSAAQISEPVLVNSTDANAGRLDFSEGNNFHISMLSSLNLDIPDNLTLGQSGVIRVEQDADGDNALTFNDVFKFSAGNVPDNTRTGEAVDLFGYYVDHVSDDSSKHRISVVPVLDTTRIS